MYRARPGSRRGLGAYPTDCFYDPNRPGWLPYFIDTPTESQAKLACFYGAVKNVTAQQIINPSVSYPPPPVPARPSGPSTLPQEQIPGEWTPDLAIAEADTQTQQQNVTFFQNLARSLPGGPSGPSGLSTTAMIALGLAAGAVLLLATSGGRRRR